MADNLDPTQSSSTQPTDQNAPVVPPVSDQPPPEPAPEPPPPLPDISAPPPPPSDVSASDSLIVPPPGTDTGKKQGEESAESTLKTDASAEPAMPPAPEDVKPKKKGVSTKAVITGFILLIITLPLTVLGVKNTLEIRSQAKECVTDDCSVTVRDDHVFYDESMDSGKDDKDTAEDLQKDFDDQKKLDEINRDIAATMAVQSPGVSPSPGSGAPTAEQIAEMQAKLNQPTTVDPGRFGFNYDTGKGASVLEWKNPDFNIAGTYIHEGKRYIIGIPDTYNAAIEYSFDNPLVLQQVFSNQATTDPNDFVVFPSTTGTPGQTWVPPGVGCYQEGLPACTEWHWTTCTHAGTGVNGVGCDVAPDDDDGGDDDGGETPTPPPQCISLVAYKNGSALSGAELAALNVGDVITLALAPGGSATKVRFRVKAGDTWGNWNESTTKNANSQFVWDYTLTDATSFNIEGEWFDGTSWH